MKTNKAHQPTSKPKTRSQSRQVVPKRYSKWMNQNTLLPIVVFVLPLVSWSVARLFNPSGWMSHSYISAAYLDAMLFLPLAIMVLVPLLIILLIGKAYRRKSSFTQTLRRVALVVGVLYSAHLYFMTVTARSEEPE